MDATSRRSKHWNGGGIPVPGAFHRLPSPPVVLLLRCGQIAPVQVAAFIVAAAATSPGSSHITGTVSDLSEQGRPHAWIMQAGLVLLGLLLIMFSMGLAHVLPAGSRWVALGVGLFGAAVIITGVLQDYNEANHGPHNREGFYHNSFGILAMAALVSSMALMIRISRKYAKWTRLYRMSRLLLGLVVANGALFLWGPVDIQGLVERAMYAAALMWIAALSRFALAVAAQMPPRAVVANNSPRTCNDRFPAITGA